MFRCSKYVVILVMGILVMSASNAWAVKITVNGATQFDSGGFENDAVGANPSAISAGLGYQCVEFINTYDNVVSNVEVVDSTGGGPAARAGDNYLVVGKTAGIDSRSLGAIMALETPAVAGDTVVAELSFYADTTRTQISSDPEVWDFAAFFPFVCDYTGFFGHNHTWMGFAHQSTWVVANLPLNLTGAGATDMVGLYYDGTAWNQITKTDGSPIFVSSDQWHDLSIILSVGQNYSAVIDGVATAAMSLPSDRLSDTVIGLQAMINGGTTAQTFYIDDALSATTFFPGDANRDTFVNEKDAALLAQYWLVSGTHVTWAMGDFNGDFVVDDKDATMMAVNWSAAAASVSVPEAGSLVLIFGALGMFLANRIYSRGRRLLGVNIMRSFLVLAAAALAVLFSTAVCQAVVITNNTTSTTVFDSGGFESFVVGGDPLSLPAGSMIYRKISGIYNDSIEVYGASGGGPAAAEGSKYLKFVDELPYLSGESKAHLMLDTPAHAGENIVANLAVYVDSQGQPLPPGALGEANYVFAFTKYYTDYPFPSRYTWLALFVQSDLTRSILDTTGITENQMIVAYYNNDIGAWRNLTAGSGSQNIYLDIDAWQDMSFDLTLGSGYTCSIEGVESDFVALEGAVAGDSVTSLLIFNNDATATSLFYIDSPGAASACSSVPEPGAAFLLISGLAALIMLRRGR